MTIKSTRRNGKAYKKGLMLSVDPSTGATGNVGIALFDKGKLVHLGEVKPDGKVVHERLRDLSLFFNEKFTDKYELLMLEQLDWGQGGPSRGKKTYVPKQLIGAVYVTQASVEAKKVEEIRPQSWQAMAKYLGDWTTADKSDHMDALWIGITCIMLANDWPEQAKFRTKKGRRDAMAIIKEVGTKYDWWEVDSIKNKWENATDETVESLFGK